MMTVSKLLFLLANKFFQILTSTNFLMCLLMTVGSGLGTTPDAHSRGTTGLLGVVGEVGCWETSQTQRCSNLNYEIQFPVTSSTISTAGTSFNSYTTQRKQAGRRVSTHNGNQK